MIALQAGGTDVAVARASEDGNGGLDSARQPNSDPVTRLQSVSPEIARQSIGGLDELLVGKTPETISNGPGFRSGGRRAAASA